MLSWKQINKKWFSTILISGNLLIAGIVLIFISFKDETIFPHSLEDYRIIGYHEEGPSHSVYSIQKSPNKLTLSYSLTSSRPDPFTAVVISKKDSTQTLVDLDDMNKIMFRIKAKKGKRIPVMLTFEEPSVNDTLKKHKRIAFEDEIQIGDKEEYELNLQNFKPADWWLRFHGKNQTDLRVFEYKNLKSIIIGSCKILKGGGNDEIEISEINIYHNNKPLIFKALLFTLCFNISVFFVFIFPVNKKIFVPVQATNIEPIDHEKLEAIKLFIGQKFSNPELNLHHAEDKLNINAKEINTILKQDLNSNFNQYLNMVRIIEAKNLLLQTHLPIAEIAVKCGYKHVTHFNRIFKGETNLSPKDFKLQHKV